MLQVKRFENGDIPNLVIIDPFDAHNKILNFNLVWLYCKLEEASSLCFVLSCLVALVMYVLVSLLL